MLYKNLSGYLRQKYGKRLKKICIDAGFGCPNRDGKCGTGGCIYCGERGAGEHIADYKSSIFQQVYKVLSQAIDDELFIAYFQNFTNTYASIEVLKQRYDAALFDERIKVLSIGTRPDCIDEDIARLLSEYAKEREVWVELGLQTSDDNTADIINRGYKTEVFAKAVQILHRYNIKVVAHMIIGLPTESKKQTTETARYISNMGVFGIKIHSIYVMKDTKLAEMFFEKRYTPPTLDEYAECVAEAIANINPNIIVHRITGDCPKDLLISPLWNKDKNEIISAVNRSLEQHEYTQGCLLEK